MGMSIKNEETERLAKELARATGESITGAITEALRERRARQRTNTAMGLRSGCLKSGRIARRHFAEPFRSADHGELLHDEKGLPR
jgi:antitoxin VapB